MPESQTIGRAELLAVLKALYEVTKYRWTCVMCDSEYVVNGCNGWAQRWRRNNWHTATGPMVHADLWKRILILLESYGPHVTVRKGGEREDPEQDLHSVGVRESTPPPQPDDVIPWTPKSVLSRADSSVIICTPETRPSDRIFIILDTPSPQHSQDFTDFEVQ